MSPATAPASAELRELPELVTTNYVAGLFSVTNYTVREWIRQGLIRGRKVHGRWRVERQSVIDFANERYGS